MAESQPCPWCGRPATLLCDGRVIAAEGDRSTNAHSCNTPVCRPCAELVDRFSAIVCNRGRGKDKGCKSYSDTRDLCPFCQKRPHPLERSIHEAQLAEHVQSTRGPQPGDTLWLLDAHNLAYKTHHASTRPVMAPRSGQSLTAVTGFVRSLRALREREGRDRVKWVVPVFDGGGITWRHELHPDYKSTRPPCPPELEKQWPLLHNLMVAMRLPLVKVDGVEADDLIAAYTEAAVRRGVSVVIISNDKDLLQLVRGDDGVQGSVRQLRREKDEDGKPKHVFLGPQQVVERFGVGPDRLGDLLALVGDSADSIPGIPGVGEKTAARILNERGSLDQALSDWSLITGRVSKMLLGDLVHKHEVQVRLSKTLVDLRSSLKLPVELHDLRPWQPSGDGLDMFFRTFGFPHWRVAVDPAE